MNLKSGDNLLQILVALNCQMIFILIPAKLLMTFPNQLLERRLNSPVISTKYGLD